MISLSFTMEGETYVARLDVMPCGKPGCRCHEDGNPVGIEGVVATISARLLSDDMDAEFFRQSVTALFMVASKANGAEPEVIFETVGPETAH